MLVLQLVANLITMVVNAAEINLYNNEQDN